MKLGSELVEMYRSDRTSRQDWEDQYVKGLEFLTTNYTAVTKPFQGASTVTHPLLSEAVTQFQAQAFKELLPSEGPVRTQIYWCRRSITCATSTTCKRFYEL